MNIEEIKKQYPEFTGKAGCRFIDETGNKYGKLTVLYRSANNTKGNKAKWICQCECGTIKEVIGKDLREGKTVSCGCSKVQRIAQLNVLDITGKRYGKLVAIRPTEERRFGKVVWECKCDCGNIHYATASSLQNGSVKSCGCLRSYGETLTEQVLKDLGLIYKTQYQFADLVSLKNNRTPLRFDFAVFDKNGKLAFLIEFDGEQHEIVYEKWTLPFENDRLKNEYCCTHNINLLRISYKDRNYNAIYNIVEKYIKENHYEFN